VFADRFTRFLFLFTRALSLDDIVAELGVSKGSVSINIRILEDYKLVRKVWMKGTRKDYYEAVDMIPTKIVKEFFDKIRRNIQDSLDMIRDCEELADRTPRARGKLEGRRTGLRPSAFGEIKSFYANATSCLKPFIRARH
jgi:DNA-binding transcriptional regulator GbsR (MarR family)